MSQKQTSKDGSRKEKRRHNFENKIIKITNSFISEKDLHYKDRLTQLQTNLTSLHQGNNPIFLRKLHDLEEERDLELVRLRLYEEYRVSRSGIEFQEDIEKAKEDHEKLVKLCKEKLYATIQQKIKKLQEERLLMDVANAHSYSMDYSRQHFQKNTRSHTASGGWESSSNELERDTATESATDTASERRSLRRRMTAKDSKSEGGRSGAYYAIGEESEFKTGYSTAGTGRSSTTAKGAQSDLNSDSDFLQGIGDYADLEALLLGEKDNKNNDTKKKHRANQRYSSKSAPPLPSLSMDEVTEDISLIRNLTNQPPAPFKVRND